MTDELPYRLAYVTEVIRRECVGLSDNQFEEVKALLDELPKLRDAAKTLAALEAAGVDNWEGYRHAQELMEE